jgi:hypothetical protein
MIKVTIGESKPQEKPFPKLMKSNLGQILFAELVNPDNDNWLIGTLLHTNNHPIGNSNHSDSWCREKFTDYNETVTLQNA